MSNPIDDALMSKEALGGIGQLFQGLGQGLGGQGMAGGRGLFGSALRRTGQQFGSKVLQGLGDSGVDVGKGLAMGAAGALGAAGIAGLGMAVQKLTSAATKRRDFREMMDLNPDLEDVQNTNPKFFNASYSSIRRLNPTYGKDPIVAGSLMRRMMDNPSTAGTILAGTLREPEAPRSPTELSVSGSFGPMEYRHRF